MKRLALSDPEVVEFALREGRRAAVRSAVAWAMISLAFMAGAMAMSWLLVPALVTAAWAGMLTVRADVSERLRRLRDE